MVGGTNRPGQKDKVLRKRGALSIPPLHQDKEKPLFLKGKPPPSTNQEEKPKGGKGKAGNKVTGEGSETKGPPPLRVPGREALVLAPEMHAAPMEGGRRKHGCPEELFFFQSCLGKPPFENPCYV